MGRPKSTTPPALAAMRNVAQAFVAEHESLMHGCFFSDLEKHDRAAIERDPDRPFVWAIWPHGTHMIFLPKVGEARDRATDRERIRSMSAVESTFTTDTPLEWWCWDGTALRKSSPTAVIQLFDLEHEGNPYR